MVFLKQSVHWALKLRRVQGGAHGSQFACTRQPVNHHRHNDQCEGPAPKADAPYGSELVPGQCSGLLGTNENLGWLGHRWRLRMRWRGDDGIRRLGRSSLWSGLIRHHLAHVQKLRYPLLNFAVFGSSMPLPFTPKSQLLLRLLLGSQRYTMLLSALRTDILFATQVVRIVQPGPALGAFVTYPSTRNSVHHATHGAFVGLPGHPGRAFQHAPALATLIGDH